MKITTIRLDETTLEKVRERASKLEITPTEYMRRVIRTAVEERPNDYAEIYPVWGNLAENE